MASGSQRAADHHDEPDGGGQPAIPRRRPPQPDQFAEHHERRRSNGSPGRARPTSPSRQASVDGATARSRRQHNTVSADSSVANEYARASCENHTISWRDRHQQPGDRAGAMAGEPPRRQVDDRHGGDPGQRRQRPDAVLAEAERARPDPRDGVVQIRRRLGLRDRPDHRSERHVQQPLRVSLVQPEALQRQGDQPQQRRQHRQRGDHRRAWPCGELATPAQPGRRSARAGDRLGGHQDKVPRDHGTRARDRVQELRWRGINRPRSNASATAAARSLTPSLA